MKALVPDLDRLLACRGLRHHTLGPTGAHVFAARLDNALGLRGRFCFRHDGDDYRLPDPIILNLLVNGQPCWGKRAACMWYPSHVLRQTKEHGLGLIEHKFVTWDDVICDVLELSNAGTDTLAVRLEAETGAARELTRAGRDTLIGSRPVGAERARMLLAMPTTKAVPQQRLVCEITLPPGETTSLLVALAVGVRPGETQAALKRWAQTEDPLARQRGEYQDWFERYCPALDCPDQRFVRLWWYRWFLLRHNLTRVRAGDAEGLAFHEAREGAQCAVRVAGAAPILQEARWLRSSEFAHGEMRALLAGRSEDGLFHDLPHEPQAEERRVAQASRMTDVCREWLPVAMWGALQVWPDEELLGEVAEASLRHLASLRERCDPDHNLLLGRAAGPLQTDEEAAPAEDVAHTAMFVASLQATGEMLAQAGRELEARWHLGLAERCRAALLERMWDEWDGFFYDLDRASGDPVRVPHADGFAPFAFGIVPDEGPYGKALAALVDERHFWTAHPAAEVSVTAGDGHPLARLTLPYTNSLVAEAMAFAIRRLKQRHITRRRLMDFLWLRPGMQGEGEDSTRLACRQVYDTHTGEGYGAWDCLQSCLNDLVIRHVVGVTPMPDGGLEVSPLCTGWDWFALTGVPYRGHTIDVRWDKRTDRKREAETPKGLSVWVDGKLVAESPELERLPVTIA